MPSWWNW